MNNLREQVADFLAYLEVEKNASHYTVRNYRSALLEYAGWSESNGYGDEISYESVRKFRQWMNGVGGKPKKNTQNFKLTAIRGLLRFLAKSGVPCMSPERIELAKSTRKAVDWLTPGELDALLKAAESHKARDRAIIGLLASSGLRVSELASLKGSDFDPAARQFTVRGKGDKLRLAFCSADAAAWVVRYLGERPATLSDYLFQAEDHSAETRTHHPPLSTKAIQRMVRKYALLAGLGPRRTVTPHTLRHTFATALLRRGADIRSVQSMLGHSSITTTQFYTHVSDFHLRQAYEKFTTD